MDDNFVSYFKAFDPATDLINNAGGIGPGNMISGFVNIKDRQGNAKPGPDAVIINSGGHDQYKHFVRIYFRHINNFLQHGLFRGTMTVPANNPGMHFGGNMTNGRDFADLIQVFDLELAFQSIQVRWLIFSLFCHFILNPVKLGS